MFKVSNLLLSYEQEAHAVKPWVRLIRLLIVDCAADAAEAQRHADRHQPDLILQDNHMPGVHGVDALAGLREVAPQAKVLMLTVSEDARHLAAVLRGGASGYLLKTVDSDVLAAVILRTMAGESIISPEMTTKLVQAFQAEHLAQAPTPPAADPPPDPLSSLSARVKKVVA